MRNDRRFFLTLLIPLLLGAAASTGCYVIAGASLDWFIGSVLLTALLIPPLVLIPARANDAILIALGIILGIAGVWSMAVPKHAVTLGAYFSCVLVLAAFVAAIAAAARLLVHLRITPVLASGIVTVLSLAWLSWPVWASPWTAGRAVVWPVILHPLFAINAVCLNLGVWSEQNIAYHLTNLGQDTRYTLPTTIYPAVAAHVIVAVILVVFNMRVIARKPIKS